MSAANDTVFKFDSHLGPYLEAMVTNLPNGSKLAVKALSKRDFNKEDLSLKAGVRRGELNYVLGWIEALGLVAYTTSGRQKLYKLTPLGLKAYEEFESIFHALKEEPWE
ncbi:MAG: hypothetical protein ACE3L7_14435 [Candidatus Pristimantibacillus sp.]